MTMRKSTFSMMLAAGVLAGTVTSASAQDASGQATYRDIEQTLGSVPTFFKMFPEAGIAGAWAEFKSVQLNPKTALNGKTKELIGLAVAAQVPATTASISTPPPPSSTARPTRRFARP